MQTALPKAQQSQVLSVLTKVNALSHIYHKLIKLYLPTLDQTPAITGAALTQTIQNCVCNQKFWAFQVLAHC